MQQTLGDHYLADTIDQFRKARRLAERAIAQVDDNEFFASLDAEANSIAILVKHMAGNMRSRWRDFLTSDGEKPDRNRDREFVIDEADTRDALIERWNDGWAYLFDALEPLSGDDLMQPVLIRSQPHTIVEAINRQLTHYSYHVGQIVLLAKHIRGSEWHTLSIARGESAQFNADMQTPK